MICTALIEGHYAWCMYNSQYIEVITIKIGVSYASRTSAVWHLMKPLQEQVILTCILPSGWSMWNYWKVCMLLIHAAAVVCFMNEFRQIDCKEIDWTVFCQILFNFFCSFVCGCGQQPPCPGDLSKFICETLHIPLVTCWTFSHAPLLLDCMWYIPGQVHLGQNPISQLVGVHVGVLWAAR